MGRRLPAPSMSLSEIDDRIDQFDRLNRLRSLTDAETDELCRLFDRRRDHLSHQARKMVLAA